MVAVAPSRERVLKQTRERVLKQNAEKKKTTKPPTSHRLKSGVVMELINDYLTQERNR